MPTADKFEAPQGYPFDPVLLRAISEGMAGNGIVSPGDLAVTATATALEISVAAGTAYYGATEVSINTPPQTFTLTAGDANDDRWDTVYFDTATGNAGVRQGTPAAAPLAPDIQGDEILLAIVFVEQNASDVTDTNILNWRARFSNEAEQVHYNDSTAVYGVSDVASALDDLQEAAQIGAYPLALADLASPFALPSISDMDAAGNDLTDSTAAVTIWDTSAGVVPQAQLGGPASSLTSYPLPIGDLNSPFALPSITDMDAAGTDLTDSTAAVTIWDTSLAEVPQAQLGGPASSLSTYPLSLATDTEASAYPLVHGTDTDAPADAHHTPPDSSNPTASGDGTVGPFSLAHTLGAIPTTAQVQPTSADAATDTFYVSNKTSTAVEVTYTTAPPSGTGNLTFDLTVFP